MAATALRLYRRTSVPQRLQALAGVTYAAVFAVLVTARHPGLGIGQGFYVPIVLAGLSGTLATGAGAGLLAAFLYDLGLVLDSGGGASLASARTSIHLGTYVAAGAIVGYFAARARLMLSEALHTLDELLRIARRDVGTGVLNAQGLDATLARWIASGASFALLVGELDCDRRDEAGLRQALRVLREEVGANAEAARVGPAQVAVVTWLHDLPQARAAAAEIELALAGGGCRATFGWAVHPGEGSDAISLFRAASERLYARRIVRGEWRPTAASAGLADEATSPA